MVREWVGDRGKSEMGKEARILPNGVQEGPELLELLWCWWC